MVRVQVGINKHARVGSFFKDDRKCTRAEGRVQFESLGKTQRVYGFFKVREMKHTNYLVIIYMKTISKIACVSTTPEYSKLRHLSMFSLLISLRCSVYTLNCISF